MKKIILSLLLLGTVLSAHATDVTCSAYDYLLPNPDDCSSFYICDNGNPVLMTCSLGLWFNNEEQICDYPYNVECDAASTTPSQPESTTPEPTSTSTTSKPTSTTPRPTQPTTTPRPTRPTTTKRPTTQRPTTTKRPTTIRPTTTKRPTTPKPTTTTTEQPTTEKPVVCPRDSVVFLPIPHNCQQYILCYIVGNTTLTCPAGLEFDPVRLICNLPLFAQCDHGTKTLNPNTRTMEGTTSSEDDGTAVTQVQVPSTTSNYEPDCPESGYAVIANPDNCSSFYVCVNGIYGFVNCPTGMDFNPETNRCDLPAGKHCRRGTKEAPATLHKYIPSCPVNGTIAPRDCSCSCNCGGGAPPTSTAKPTTTTRKPTTSTTSKPTTTTQKPTTSTTSKPTTTTQKPTTSTTSKPTTARPSSTTSQPASCSVEGELEPNPRDCSSFLQCVNGRLVKVNCPSGLEYNAVMKRCDYPDVANCQAEEDNLIEKFF